MRKLLASAALALSLSAPMVAMPPAAEAQQLGLVNVSVLDDGNVEVLNNLNVAAAVQAIVQACDVVDVGEANVLVLRALSTGSAVISDCDQVGDQGLTITQQNEKRGGGRGNR